ncbi:hypothetical protein B9G98_03480 [Wickerhamiella sorbophila]|uniref:Uncharacterized protein n=1 Tax=Wickerhamiella sorbophila TaxID=45607 RepID=A0A2T0FLL1_9ASCO|nr:hypothetical protein B9G98_03480 [Wickerhamiella sorbophila]PRT55860.1 hypothetical protein B9G98_03480 [Wickerhamiella sorbophila]
MQAAPNRGRQPDQALKISGETIARASRSPVACFAGRPSAPSAGVGMDNVFDAMERENEAVVNKLQREICALKEGSRSRSTSVSSATSARSTSTSRTSGLPDRRTSDIEAVTQLKRENEALHKKIAKLTALLQEKELEIEKYRTQLGLAK